MTETKIQKPNVTPTPEPQKFPSEIIDLPSGGKIYGKDSPLYEGKIEIKYMTAKEEDILTSANLIKKGAVLEKLMDSLILTPGVKTSSLVLGDKNAIMVAIRILAYGPEYRCEVSHPDTGEKMQYTFNLADCPYKKVPEDVNYSVNEFEFQLPVSKVNVKWKLLTGLDDEKINAELEAKKKLGSLQSSIITTRLKHLITEWDGVTSKLELGELVDNMLSKDSLALRNEVTRVSPDIEMKTPVEFDEGGTVDVDIPLTVNFFWPETEG
tara:strand:+ start:92 stop:892 length:801 start_codon:yes stop_codon:yes gene_type:complete